MRIDEEFPDEEIEDVEIPDDDEGDETPTADVGNREYTVSLAAAFLAVLLFMASAYRTLRGMYGHDPGESIRTIGILIVVGVTVGLFSTYSLAVTRRYEGTIVRGLALAAVVLSAVALMLLANSEITLLRLRS